MINRTKSPHHPLGNSGKAGAVNELRVAVDLLTRGYDVFRAVAQACSCDLVALKDGKIYRIEVTTGYATKDGRLVPVKHDTSRYDIIAFFVNGELHYNPEPA